MEGPSAAKKPRIEGGNGNVPCCSSYKLKESVLDHVEDNFECFICRDWVVGTTAMAPCGHIGCSECIEQWLKRNKTCPVCRQKCASLVPIKTVDCFLEKMLMPLLDDQERKAFQERVQRCNDKAKAASQKKNRSSKSNRTNSQNNRNSNPGTSASQTRLQPPWDFTIDNPRMNEATHSVLSERSHLAYIPQFRR